MGDNITWQEDSLVKFKKIKVISFSLLFASFNAVFSFILCIIMLLLLLVGIVSGANISIFNLSFVPFLMVCFIPVVVWILFFIFGLVFSLILNLLLKLFGGVKLYLQEGIVQKEIPSGSV